MKNQKGFSLIELLVVVIIIAIIAAIAIPSLLSSRRAANEASAIGSLRTLSTANATYQATLGGGSLYATSMTILGPGAGNAGLIDGALAAATAAATDKSGYFFTYAPLNTPAAPTQYTVQGTPSAGVATGRNFFLDESGVVRAAAGAAATVASAPIE